MVSYELHFYVLRFFPLGSRPGLPLCARILVNIAIQYTLPNYVHIYCSGDGGGPIFIKEYYSCRTEILVGVIRRVKLIPIFLT